MEKYNIFSSVSLFCDAEGEKETLSRCGLEFANLECDVIDNGVMQKICENDITAEAHFIECKQVNDISAMPERPLAYYSLTEAGLVRLKGAQPGCLVVYERVMTGFADITKSVVGMAICAKIRAAQNDVLLSDNIYPDGIIWSQQIYKTYNEKFGENMLDKLALLFVSAKGSVRFRGRYYKLVNELTYQNFLLPLKEAADEKGIQLYATVSERAGVAADMPSNINLAGYGCFNKMLIDTAHGLPSNITLKRYFAFSRFFAFNRVALMSNALILEKSLDEIRATFENLIAIGFDLIVMDVKENSDALSNAKAKYIKKYCDLLSAACAQMTSSERKLIFYPTFTRVMNDENDFDFDFGVELQKLEQNGIAYDICDELTFKTFAECVEGKLTVCECSYDGITFVNTENVLFATANKMQELLQQKILFNSFGEQLRLIDGVKSARVETFVKQFTPIKRIENISKTNPFRLNGFTTCRFGLLPDKSLLLFTNGKGDANISFKTKGKISSVDLLSRAETEALSKKAFSKKGAPLIGSQLIKVSKNQKVLYSGSSGVALQTGELFTLNADFKNMLPLNVCAYRTPRGHWNEPTVLGNLGEVLSDAKSGAEFKFMLNCEDLKGNVSLYVPNFTKCEVAVNGKNADKNGSVFNISSLLSNGQNEIVLSVPEVAAQISQNGMIESIFVMGNFAARNDGDITYDTEHKIYNNGNYTLTAIPEQVDINRLRESGFWHFAGVMELSCMVFVSKRGSSVYKLKFSEMNAELVQVAVNGIDVGIIGFAPYEINVGDYLSDGDNKITVKLYSPESSLKIKTTDDGAYVFEPLGLGADRINYEFIEFDNVSKAYKIGENNVTALDKVSFNLENGEFVVIAGPSGSGKTTLLNILGGMDKADSGNVVVEGANIGKLTEKQLTNYRRNDIGFVFQQNNLVDDLTVRENVELASRLSTDAINVNIALQAIGLSDHADGIVANLSAGQQQRVAIARALAKNPKMLLCDEPTGILNKDESDEILSLLYETCKTTNKTAIVVTNNEKIFEKADRVIKLENGCIVESIVNLED